MDQAFEHLGEWWLPDRPERRRSGTLTFVPTDGLTLRLVGGLVDDVGDQAVEQFPVVHGRTSSVGNVTLLGCWQATHFPFGTRFVRPPLVVDYRASSAFLGAHFSTAEELRFRKVSVRLSHLLEWINPRSIRGEPGRMADGISTSTVTYRQPEDIRARVGPVDVVLHAEGRSSLRWYRAEMTESYVAVLEADEPWRVKEWRERVISPLEDLLTFATEAPNAATEFAVSVPGTDAEWATVVAKTRTYRPEPTQLFPHEMLFTYADVADRFEDVLRAWIGLYTVLGTVIRLLLGILHHRSRFFSTETELLTAVQAIESYHHSQREGEELPAEEHRARLEIVLGGCKEKRIRQWAERKLARSNTKSLDQRLGELLRETALATDPLVSNRRDFANRQDFVRQIVGARNFLSHLDPRQRAKRLGPGALLDARDILVVALQVLLLRELDFPEHVAAEKVRATLRYRNIGQRKTVGVEPGDDGTDW